MQKKYKNIIKLGIAIDNKEECEVGMKVYVIEKGCYSDRHVMAVVETAEEAKRLCEIFQGTSNYSMDKCSYEEYDTKRFQINLRSRFVVINNGNIWDVEYDDYDLYANYKDSCEMYEDCYCVYAETPQQAIKIAQDIHAEKLARTKQIT